MFPEELEIDPDELSIALCYLQSFEPAGIGARDASRMSRVATEGAAGIDAVSRRGANGRHRASGAARGARFRQAEAHPAHRRRRRALDARAGDEPESPAGRVVRQVGSELRHPGRRRQEGARQVDGGAERIRDAQAPAQSHLRRHPDPQPRLVEPAALRAAAGSEVADPQRPAALRDDPAGRAGHRRAPAPLLRARRRRDAADGAARDRRRCSTCTNRRSRG